MSKVEWLQHRNWTAGVWVHAVYEQFKKPGCLSFLEDEILPSYVEINKPL